MARPFLWDNAVLSEEAEGRNRFDPVRPRCPGANTAAARVLLAIAEQPRSASQLATVVGLDELQVRSAINGLRNPQGAGPSRMTAKAASSSTPRTPSRPKRSAG